MVRIYEPRAGANFMMARFKDGKYYAATLGHRDVDKAKADAYALIAAVTSGRKEAERQSKEPESLTLGSLAALYLDSESFKSLGARTGKEKAALLEKIVDYFGPSKRIVTLDDDDVRGLLRARRKGLKGFGKAGIQAEYHAYACLRSVIMWGMERKTATGARLIRENPLTGMAKRLKIRPNPTPNQPVIEPARSTALRRGGRKLPMIVRVFLVVADGAGRRSINLRDLRWDDVTVDGEKVLWRRDKMHFQMSRPTTRRVARYLRVWRKHCPSSVWLFPSPRDASKSVSASTTTAWLEALFTAAGLKREKGLGWHGCRRGWTTSRRGNPIPDLMVAGGWASHQALMRYMKPSEETIARIIQQPTHES